MMPAAAIGSCSRCESPLELGDLRCAICGQSAPDTRKQSDHPASTHQPVTILRCHGCAAAMAYDPEHQAPHCSFCGEVVKMEQIFDPMEQTEAALPFLVEADQAKQALRRWLGTLGWFRPSDLTTSARLEKLQPLWWVGWTFDAVALVSWTADSDADARRSRWAPHAGRDSIRFDNIVVSASRGLTPTETDIVSRGLKLQSAVPVSAVWNQNESSPADSSPVPSSPIPDESRLGAPRGVTLEQFDLPRSQARQHIVQTIENLARTRVQSHFIPGSRFRNVHVAVVIRQLETRRLAFPAYVLAYRYRDKLYRVAINGQDPQFLAGSAPFSVAKMVMTAAAVILALLVMLSLVALLSAN